MNKTLKIFLITITVLVFVIILDTLQARILKNSPLISFKQLIEDEDSWVDKGIIIDTYYCTKEKDIVTVSWHLKLSKFTCPIDNNGIKITKETFPEEVLRNKAKEYDKNNDKFLTEKEAFAIEKLYIKKLADKDIIDISEDEPLPEYTTEDFHFNFKGIEYFYNLKELDINLLGGEAFNKDSKEEILVTTENFNNIYELKNLTKLSMYEVDIEKIDITQFPKLKRLEMNFMYNMKNISFKKHNNLNNLWISNIDNLEIIDISNLNKIKKIHLEYNKNLKEIVTTNNNSKVEELDLISLPKLKNINLIYYNNLKKLNIIEVPLTNLDLSTNYNLDSLCLESLSLNTLDLSNNKKLTYLINDKDSAKKIIIPNDNIIDMIRWTNSNITVFPIDNLNPDTLTGIDIQGTKIKTLDITKYLNIEYLYYDDTTTIIK